MKEYAISEELINKILQYLGTKPYVEVQDLITKLIQTCQIQQTQQVQPGTQQDR